MQKQVFKKESLMRAWAEIDLERLKRNYEKCRSIIGQCEMMAVVKANCYGHGIDVVIPCLEEECGANWFAVSNLVEAIELRELGVSGEILILGYTPPKHAAVLTEYDIIQAITDYDYANELSIASPKGDRVRTHVAFDTGMSRIGLRNPDFKALCDEAEKIFRLPGLSVEGIFTHLSVADSSDQGDEEYTKKQIAKLMEIKRELNRRLIIIEHLHFLNSAGAAYNFDGRGDLVRFGIMLYGLSPNPEIELPVDLEPVMALKATVGQVKILEPGADVSYGRTYRCKSEIRAAVITIGYADGYPRLLSGQADVLIHGKRAPIIGRICMDQLMVDITDIDGVAAGDVVTLFGCDGDEVITVDELAAKIGTIGYEIVCGISPRVTRIAKPEN